ncbi:MAG: hypothetical protein ABIJ27_00740 [Candidatus Omnitrophota bacterium]
MSEFRKIVIAAVVSAAVTTAVIGGVTKYAADAELRKIDGAFRELSENYAYVFREHRELSEKYDALARQYIELVHKDARGDAVLDTAAVERYSGEMRQMLLGLASSIIAKKIAIDSMRNSMAGGNVFERENILTLDVLIAADISCASVSSLVGAIDEFISSDDQYGTYASLSEKFGTSIRIVQGYEESVNAITAMSGDKNYRAAFGELAGAMNAAVEYIQQIERLIESRYSAIDKERKKLESLYGDYSGLLGSSSKTKIPEKGR